ncbi:hypothetical protein [Nonomuraea sp. 10N515B]|uniref:hypothetical protein n=1 Tax=Nonomuraea sp. 10N515B TaxID=3457422 RepID=UPI003FCE6A97
MSGIDTRDAGHWRQRCWVSAAARSSRTCRIPARDLIDWSAALPAHGIAALEVGEDLEAGGPLRARLVVADRAFLSEIGELVLAVPDDGWYRVRQRRSPADRARSECERGPLLKPRSPEIVGAAA